MPRRVLACLSLLLLASAPAIAVAGKKQGRPRKDAGHALPPPPPGSETPEAKALGVGLRALWSGDLAAARKALAPLVETTRVRNPDYALYGLAQAELLAGEAKAALAHFEKLAKLRGRFQHVAQARAADAARALVDARARALYEAALAHPAPDVDVAACRFRLAELVAEQEKPDGEGRRPRAVAAFRRVHVEHPLHPLAEAALARMTQLDPSATITPAERVARARTMTANRGWSLALDELRRLPAELEPAVRDEADYWYGTTLFRMRREYAVAALKLLAVWPRLPGDERKSEALFHGARAKSRADLDDEAIVGYRDVVSRFPRGKNAAEASFLIGWLDFNRGKYREAIPGLEATLKRYGGSFADDARWYLGLSRWFSADVEGALAEFAPLAQCRGGLSARNGGYW